MLHHERIRKNARNVIASCEPLSDGSPSASEQAARDALLLLIAPEERDLIIARLEQSVENLVPGIETLGEAYLAAREPTSHRVADLEQVISDTLSAITRIARRLQQATGISPPPPLGDD